MMIVPVIVSSGFGRYHIFSPEEQLRRKLLVLPIDDTDRKMQLAQYVTPEDILAYRRMQVVVFHIFGTTHTTVGRYGRGFWVLVVE
jgi:hypothetical protein